MEMKVENNILTITTPIGGGVPSKSGKTLVVATTNGFVQVQGTDLSVSLNVIKPK